MPELLSPEDRYRLLGFLEKRFGMEYETFEPYLVFAFTRQAFLFRKQDEDIRFSDSSFIRCGLPFMRLVAGYLKPTTVFLQRFGCFASKNILCLEIDRIAELCGNGELTLKTSPAEGGPLKAPGYVIIKTGDHVLGAALLMEDLRLLCRFPKAMRQALTRISAR